MSQASLGWRSSILRWPIAEHSLAMNCRTIRARALPLLLLVLGASARAFPETPPPPSPSNAAPALPAVTLVQRGQRLFDQNCAHCHGSDARGDEGPSLYNLTLTDRKITDRIKNGIKGEMPRFGSKFDTADLAALVAYLRTLKE